MNSNFTIKNAIILFLIFGIFAFLAVSSSQSKDSGSSSAPSKETVQKSVGVGEALQTDYFEITVNSVKTADRVNTGNQFANLPPEKNNKYLIMDVTFKNTDSESRMISDGSVFINYNGKDYEFDAPETLMLEGWGTMLDQLNPLTTKTTKLVYKLPAEIQGIGTWRPGRSSSDEVINLGEIK